MSAVEDDDIRTIVAATLAEQQRQQRDEIDAIVLRAIATILTSSGSRKRTAKNCAPIFSTCGDGARALNRRKAIPSRLS